MSERSIMHIVRLSAAEYKYIESLSLSENSLLPLIERAKLYPDHAIIEMYEFEDVERFRDIFTEELAIMGFDKNYSLTNEGKILENLIDKFYIQKL